MDLDVEEIIQCMKRGDQDGVQAHLHNFNTEYSECFFFNVEARDRRKQQELEEFRQKRVRTYVPDSDSDFNSDSESEDPDLILRRRLAAALVWFIRMRLQPGVLQVCLRTLRILSRDRQALGALVTDTALLTLARLGGIGALVALHEEVEEEQEGWCFTPEPYGAIELDPDADDGCPGRPAGRGGGPCFIAAEAQEAGGGGAVACRPQGALERGKRDARGEGEEEEEEEECDDGEMWRKEAMKALCNVIYNSQTAQERASALQLLSGLSERLKEGIRAPAPPSGQFYDLRLLFLLTALRPELRVQLKQERGVAMLTAALEQCLEVRWGEVYEVMLAPAEPPVCKEASQRAIEILKTLFNITCIIRRQEPDEEDAALYRHLAAVLRHCLLLTCEGEDRTEELQGHTVNVLSALPLQCLDVLLSVRLSAGSREWGGVNMDCVHTLLLFMEKRMDRGQKLKEKLTPVLCLLTESCKAHRETRHYLKQQILPPLRDIGLRPEQGATVRNRLVRLMTHVDTDIKDCAAELLFVLCKENVCRFVKYTGYGNAAGLLAARGLLSGCASPSRQPVYSSDSDSDTEEYREARGRINLVTGRVEEEQPDPMEGMTEEEKEREALRLMSLFSRLSRDKIIQPIGVTVDGRLVPLCGQMRSCTLEEEEESEGENEEDMEQ